MARWYLALIMGAMAALQTASFPTFVDALESHGVGGGTVAIVLGGLIIGGETLAAVTLARTHPTGPWASLVVMVVWTVLAAQAFARGLTVPNCGCFGRWFTQELRWWVLLEDLYLLVVSAWLVHKQRAATHGADGRNKAADRAPAVTGV